MPSGKLRLDIFGQRKGEYSVNAKEYLLQIQLFDERIEHKMRELDDLKSRFSVISAVDYSREKGSPKQAAEASYEKYSDRINDLFAEIKRDIEGFAVERDKAINRIHRLNNSSYEDILFKRYVEYKDFAAISNEMKFSDNYIRELHTKAVHAFEKKYPRDKL